MARRARSLAAPPLGLLWALLLTPPAAAADLASYRFTRALEVPAPGPVEVPLDLAALRHLGEGGVAVFAPGGEEVPARVERPSCCRVRAEISAAQREGETWTLLLDLGPSPPPHRQLVFEVTGITAAPAVRLEGSDDALAWRLLAAGDLVHFSAESIALTYPPNRHRWLRLTWPAAAGTPSLRQVMVAGDAGRGLEVGSDAAACRATGRAAVCALPVAAPRQVGTRLRLRLASGGVSGAAPGGRIGYRLSEPDSGRWRMLAEGTAAAGAEVTLPLPDRPLPGEPLRLELYGSEAPPRLARWSVELTPALVAFRAPAAGRYTLAYGGGGAGAAPVETRSGEPAPAAVEGGAPRAVVPGRERVQELPPLPALATGPGAPLGEAAAGSSWPVRAPRAVAGDVVRLELPAAVLAASAPALSDVRLAAGDRQVPYLRLSPETPALVAARRGARPRPERRTTTSRVALAVEPAQRLSALSLTAEPAFRRAVTIAASSTARRTSSPAPGADSIVASDLWDCSSRPPLPCRDVVDLAGAPAGSFTIRFDDGDNPPLPAVDVALWRRREVLVFVWPAAREVRLLAGSSQARAPRYDLEVLAPQLLALPWKHAALDVGGGGPAAREPVWQPWLLPAALAVAGVALLLLLRRLLASR